MNAWRSIMPILLLMLAACGTTAEKEPEKPSMDEMLAHLTEQSGNNCVEFSDIEGHEVVDKEVISVSTRRGDHYLVTITRHCNILGSGLVTLVSDSWGTLCRGFSSVTDHDRDCPIRHVYEFPSREAAMATLKVAHARREAAALIPDKPQ